MPARAAILACALLASSAAAQDNKPKPAPSGDAEIARYCGALAPRVSEARAAYQLRRLADLQSQVNAELDKLEAKEAEARDWFQKRAALLNQATFDVVAIYAKMSPEAAGPALSALEETEAAAVLIKLKPQTASAILAEMPAEKAARLTSIISGGAGMPRT
jgi:flagellar motility protein MotE (MotC chaperone)